ncbi:MAG TPA: methionine--tRNA ligase [Dehalococcoidia bacterium]|jgi:methionyl-tRNA synthetase|nr:methionine--tRNA ligase [Dehalococcoidia bacterium]
MRERIFIGVAWPYADGPLHLGHIAGAYLPPDIFARYHRTKGNEVLMVSGSDQHGTPITIKAEQEGKSPSQIASQYHQQFLDSWQKLGISFDLFTSTSTANHAEVSCDIFLTLLNKGYIYKATVSQPFCSQCQRFLPDRYIEGTCPYCQSSGARGDQCDECGKPINPVELVDPRCGICTATPQFKDSEHFFLRLTAFEARLLDWVKQQTHWRQNVLNFTTRYLEGGLKDRAITRDIAWGIPIPVDGFDGKCIYVWFEAVIGYLSATKEWAKSNGDEEKWRSFWQGEAKSYYFIGKDNIPFHTIIWPAMLMGYDGLNLPYDVPANEFLTIEGRKLSTSRHWAVWLSDYLSRYDPDPLRYLLSINMPETGDTNFSWRGFVHRNNDELVATYGNLVHRVLTFVHRHFDGCVPTPSELDSRSQTLLNKARDTLNTMDGLLYRCHFREAIRTAMSLAQEANRYLEEKSPWKMIKQDRQASATALYVAISVLSCLRIVLYPFLPFSSQKLHEFLGFKGNVGDDGWQLILPTPGQKLLPPKPLFSKLDEKLVAEETSRLGYVQC